MRTIAIIVALLIASTAVAQDATTTLPAEFFSGPQIETGAFRSKLEEARAEIQVKDRLIADLHGIVHDFEAKLATVKSCECTCNCGKQAKAEQPTSAWKITMVTMDGCEACPIAREYHAPRYKAKNWAWSERSDGKGLPGMWYPYYEVCTDSGCTVIQCRNIYELDARITELLANKTQQPMQDKRGRFLGNW